MSLCARICAFLCCKIAPDPAPRPTIVPAPETPEVPLSIRLSLIGNAHIIADQEGFIRHIHPDLHLERLLGALIRPYMHGAGAGEDRVRQTTLEFPGHVSSAFYQREVTIEERVFSVFNRVVPLTQEAIPNDEILHLAGNMLSISSDAEVDPQRTLQKMAISAQIIYCKSHLATLREKRHLELSELTSKDLQSILLAVLNRGQETIPTLKQMLDVQLPHGCSLQTHKESLTYLIREAYYLLIDRLKGGQTLYCLITPSSREDRFYLYIGNSYGSDRDFKEGAMSYLKEEVASEEIMTPATLSNGLASQFLFSGEPRNFQKLKIYPRIKEDGTDAVTFLIPCTYDAASPEEVAHTTFEHAVSYVEGAPSSSASRAPSPIQRTRSDSAAIRLSPSRIAQIKEPNPCYAKDQDGRRVSIAEGAPSVGIVGVRRVLVVDDEAANRRIAIRHIKRLYPLCEIIEAGDGTTAVSSPCREGTTFEQVQEAIEKKTAGELLDPARKPDIVFMDIKMLHMNGLEASRDLHKLYPGLPIYPMTANSSEADKKRYEEAGMLGQLTISKDTLSAGIASALTHATSKEVTSPSRAPASSGTSLLP